MRELWDLIIWAIKSHFDKLLLVGVLFILIAVGYLSTVMEVKTWAMGQANTVIGAVIALVMKEIKGQISEKP